MAALHHAINYIEFPVTDMARAQAFYEAAFGWQCTEYGPGYAGIQKPGSDGSEEIGGFALVDEVTAGGVLVVLFSRDLEASLAAVREAGGEIVKEIFEFPGGRRFEFRDPFGHGLAVWGELPAES